jgi:hypothetical protein
MYVAEEDDDQQDREFFRCFVCPLYETCKKSKSSFKNSCCFSYVDEETCRQYVQRHLLLSGIHKEDNLTEDNANDLAQNAEITMSFETYEERQAYRSGLENKPTEPDHPPPPQRKRPRDGDEPRAAAIGARNKAPGATPQVEALGFVVGQLASALQAAGCGSSSGSSLQATNNAALALRSPAPTAQGVELVTDSMNRILESIGHATSQCITTARTLNEEGQRLRAAVVAIEQQLKRG